MAFKLEIVSLSATIFEGDVISVICPGIQGDLEIMTNHTQLLTQLKPGSCSIVTTEQPDNPQVIYISGGILEVQPNITSILADEAKRADEIDAAAANAAILQAEASMKNNSDKIAVATAKARIAEAVAQIAALRKIKS